MKGEMDSGSLRAIAALLAAALAGLALLLATDDRAIGDGLSPDTPRITSAQRAAAATYDGGVPPLDRQWIQAAIAGARPEAQRLIEEVDGLVRYEIHRGDPLGVTRSVVSPEGARFTISFDVTALDGERRQDRAVTVLHEYGHAIDFALVPQELNDALEAGIPRTGACGRDGGVLTGSCAEPAERFADTFAKWALRGGVSAVGAGYQVANPPSLEDWGAPLTALANELVAAR
jgi:hypothetical protein